ncbi:hypothetical protein DFH08DRAFT_933306 [Mycena albidolilacea]|uniref:Zn(2)-C6 fungal-type domain-containing protein n=1 Tax=Mycena albidolilacea TaxID=1033008 RepID=A0AAD7EYV0_9AGAR|nr:hypothetical protein DFH08DRAFT_933306 [Mycena albidolilacea]
MSSKTPSQSTLAAFTQKKRIYVACIPCRKRKIRCVTIDDSPNTPCKRCTEKGLECEYLAVCEEREKSLFTEGSAYGQRPPATPQSSTWNQPSHGHGGSSSTGVYAHNYAQPAAPQSNPYYGQSSASQYSQSPGPYTNPAPAAYPTRPRSQQYPSNPSNMYPSSTNPTLPRSNYYQSSGVPYQPSRGSGVNPNYNSSNFNYPDPNYPAQYNSILAIVFALRDHATVVKDLSQPISRPAQRAR